MTDIRSWLEAHGLAEYVETFAENDVDLEVLPELSDDELKELGLSLGHRKKLKKAVREKLEVPAASPGPKGAAPAGQTSGEAERRQLTVMFCDLVGSTALSESMDTEDYRGLLAAYQAAVSGAIRESDGYIARYMGDGLLAYFGYPIAQENDAERAARAGLALLDAVSELDIAPPLEVRVGIATGPVVVGDIIGEGASEEAAVLGETPNLAARLQSAAAPNTVLLGPITQQLLRERIETEALAPLELKGLSQPVVPYRALRARSLSEVGEARFDSLPLVGREVELSLLERAWRTSKSGEGQALLLTAEPGVGKSRLLRAFQDMLSEESVTRVLWYCSPYYQTTANFPAIEQLKRVLQVQAMTPEESLEHLVKMLEGLDLNVEFLGPTIASLLSLPILERFAELELSPEEMRRRFVSAQTDLLLAAAQKAPVLFVVEDLHWVDPSTLEVLGEVIEAIRDSRVLVLLTARPEFRAPWLRHTNMATHSLSHLNRQETLLLVESIVQERGLGKGMVDQIVERTDGVALYVEELTKDLLESTADSVVPTSLQDSLMARLDRLGPIKELAQTASVIGRGFTARALSAVAQEPHEKVLSDLEVLIDSGLVNRRRGHGEEEFEFKHALVRDSAYENLLRDRRRELHRRAAEVLRQEYPDIASQRSELVAYHYTAAGEQRSALQFWTMAGQRSVQRFENAEAERHFRAALEVIESLPVTTERDAQELEVVLALGTPTLATYGYAAPEVVELFERALVLSDRLHDTDSSFIAIRGLWHNLMERGELRAARERAEELMALANATGQDESQAVAIRALGSTLFLLGENKRALGTLSERAIASPSVAQNTAVKYGDPTEIGIALYQASSEAFLGLTETSTRRLGAILEEAEAHGDPLALAFTLCFCAIGGVYRNMPDVVLQFGDRALELARANDLISWEAHARVCTGWAHAQLGDAQTGIERIRSGTHAWEHMGAKVMLPVWSTLLADALLSAGDQAGARSEIEACLGRWGDVDEAFYRADSWRVRGDVFAAAGPSEHFDAEASYREAVRIARSQDARLLECKANLHLAQLLVSQAREREAANLLTSTLNLFREGFDDPYYNASSTLLRGLQRSAN